MDKIMSDARVSSFLSILKFVIIGIGMGSMLLITQMNGLMQLLGLRPMTDDFKKDEVIVLSLMGVFLLGLAIFFIVGFLTGRKELKETFAHSGMDEGRIVADYENAWNVSRSLKIGNIYTYDFGEISKAYLNSEIVRVHEFFERGDCFIALYFSDGSGPKYVTASKSTYREIMQYYKNHFPHIRVGE